MTRSIVFMALAVALVLSSLAVSQSMAQSSDAANSAEAQAEAPSFDVEALMRESGGKYAVSEFVVVFDHVEESQLPRNLDVWNAPIRLGRTPQGFVEPHPALELQQSSLGRIAVEADKPFYETAIQSICSQLIGHLNSRGLLGIVVAVDPQQIDPDTLEDLRPGQSGALTLRVSVGAVKEIRTLGSGGRVASKDRINNAKHHQLLERSTVQIGQPLNRDNLESYIYRLNRHPGRRVDVALSPALEENGIALDYLVTENKPWLAFYELTNTGTESTNKWRHRFGFLHNQLTGNDDIISLQYVTAGFDESHAVVASYEAPVFDSDVFRWRVGGVWSEFTASDLGIASIDFEGDSLSFNADLTANVFSHKELFVDLTAGLTWQQIKVDQIVGGRTFSGEGYTLLPHVGVSTSYRTDRLAHVGSVDLEYSIPGYSGGGFNDSNEGPSKLGGLGRAGIDSDWLALKWNFGASTYLDPFFGGSRWKDPQSRQATLAHEVMAQVRGQYVFNDRRPIAQHQSVAGGFNTVRGYPESIISGDNVVVAQFDYVFHLPRAFARQEQPGSLLGKPFRYVPQQAYGRPDWDLAFRAFFDVGRVNYNNRQSYEVNETIAGTGVGLEFSLKQNLIFRTDWGIALTEVEDSTGRTMVSRGSNRFHFMITLMF